MTNPDVTAEAVENLDRSVSRLANEYQALRGYGQRNRHFIAGLVVVSAVLVSVIVWLSFVAVEARDAASTANLNRQHQLATCLSTNEARAATVDLWTTVLTLQESVNVQTPERIAAAAKLKAKIKADFAPRDCHALAATPPGK